jgi:hypothetical protein
MYDTLYLECNLASLVSISESNENYGIITRSTAAIGQGFKGIEIEGSILPLGGTFLEFPKLEESNSNADINDYRIDELNSISNFSRIVFDYLSKFGEIEKLNGYTSQLNGHSFKDFVLGDSLEILEMLDSKRIKNEIRSLHRSQIYHPSNKNRSDFPLSMPFEAYCRHIYGNYLYESLLEPLKIKIIGSNEIELLKYHRSNWLPLYWPESILAMMDSGRDLRSYEFYKFSEFNFSEWVAKLSRKIDHERVIESKLLSINRAGNKFLITLDDGRTIESRRVVSSLNIEQLNQIIHFSEMSYIKGNSIFIAYIRKPSPTPENKPEAQFIIDKKNSIYRISSYKDFYSIELSSSHLAPFCENERRSTVLKDFRKATGVECGPSDLVFLREFSNARVSLSENNLKYHRDLQSRNSKIGIDLTGSSAGFGLGSIADQIVQGLRLASQV